ncbi:MAG: hypothetical protein ACRBBR_02625 [Cellvibrionaceae bacterium]
MKDVTVVVTNKKTGQHYYAHSYPDRDIDNNGKNDVYKTPIYEVHIIQGANKIVWHAVRFMPYWNDPKAPNPKYKTKGFVNSGLHSLNKRAVSLYLPNYFTRNRFSPNRGAIQLRNNFLIHAGPKTRFDYGWGSAGCVEIIGDFGKFKADIRDLSGIQTTVLPGDALAKMVANKKLFVEVQYATPPNFTKLMTAS